MRQDETKKIFVVANYQNEPQTVRVPGEPAEVLLANDNDIRMDGNELTLSGYQAIVMELK